MIVFAGPSIAGIADAGGDRLDLRPPAQQGDIYLAALERPAAIGLIDGYFEGVPAVWHKEILWTLTQGIPVLGAASMGALRAAELDVFGMTGIGAIYEAYRDGVLEDDDEVALLHGPAEVGSPALTLAMVNLRATLAAAEGADVLDQGEAARLTARAKAQFYKTRSWDSVLDAVDPAVISPHRLDRFKTWLRQNEVDQKRADAQALLGRLATPIPVPTADFHFEETALWHQARREWEDRARRQSRSGGVSFLDQ